MNIIAVLSIIAFYIAIVCLLFCYKKRNDKVFNNRIRPLGITFGVVGLLLFLLWGIIRN